MDIYALVGKSGTGKSYQALNLCREMEIPCLIDDGLFIGHNTVFGGKSAKRAGTKMGAVKTALFTEQDHRDEVVKAIEEVEPESILILGTSDRMVYRIAERLGLPPIKKIIYIEDISSPEEIETAGIQRMKNGKHAIPVATFQLKREFSGYFLKPLKIWRRVGSRSTMVAEKSEVRPTYSYLGSYTISERAVYDIMRCTAESFSEIVKVTDLDIEKSDGGMDLYISVIMKYGVRMKDMGERIQERLNTDMEEMTGFNINEVNLTVKGLI